MAVEGIAFEIAVQISQINMAHQGPDYIHSQSLLPRFDIKLDAYNEHILLKSFA